LGIRIWFGFGRCRYYWFLLGLRLVFGFFGFVLFGPVLGLFGFFGNLSYRLFDGAQIGCFKGRDFSRLVCFGQGHSNDACFGFDRRFGFGLFGFGLFGGGRLGMVFNLGDSFLQDLLGRFGRRFGGFSFAFFLGLLFSGLLFRFFPVLLFGLFLFFLAGSGRGQDLRRRGNCRGSLGLVGFGGYFDMAAFWA
jgi:hypothetical protein